MKKIIVPAYKYDEKENIVSDIYIYIYIFVQNVLRL